MSDHPLTWLKPLARAGYVSRGVVYTIIGSFAVLSAFGSWGNTDTEGALAKVLAQPFGKPLLWIVVVGLVGYVAWRLVQSLLDTDDHGWTPKGLAVRTGLLASAFSYTTLAIYALSILGVFSGGGGGGGENPVAQYIGGIIGMGYVTLALAAVFAGVAIAHWYKAFSRKYADHFVLDDHNMTIIHAVSMVGLTARGVVFAIISVMLFFRFRTVAGGDGGTPGIADAMSFVQDLPGGQWLLAALGVGIVLFAAYSFALARWRRINVEDAEAPG